MTRPEQHPASTSDARKRAAEVRRVHNHPPYRPACAERSLPGGQLRGACLNADGSDRA